MLTGEPLRETSQRPDFGKGELGACRFIAATVAAAMNASLADILAPRRGSARTALARGVAMYLAHVTLAMSFTEIGRQFGRDRTTVAHACARVEDRREDEACDRLIARLEEALAEWRQTLVGKSS